MAVNVRWRFGLLCTVSLILGACAVTEVVPLQRKIALLAPFEGRYREVGYEALYAIHLALADSDSENVALLAVDDGGTPDMARLRARALVADSQVYGVLVLGYAATDPAVLAAFDDLPVLVTGIWGVDADEANIFVLASAEILDLLTVSPSTPITTLAASGEAVTGAEALALNEFAWLRDDLSDVTVVSSGRLPGVAFRERILVDNPFASEPALLSTLSYDAARLMIDAVQGAEDRTAVRETIATREFSGLNGPIRFEDGYWQDAPVNYYQYNADRVLYVVP